MRIPSGNIPDQPLRHLWERHNEISRRLVAGDRPVDICREMGISQSRISVIMASPAFQARMAELSKRADEDASDVQGRLSKLSISSVGVLEEAITNLKAEGISPALRTKLAQDVLDRNGYGAIQKTQSISAVLTAADIEELKKRKRPATQTRPNTHEGIINLTLAEAAG